MLGQMMHRPLSIIEILRFAAEIHKTAEIVSVRTEGMCIAIPIRVVRVWGSWPMHCRTWGSNRGMRRLWHGTAIAFELYYAVSGMGAVCHTINPRLSAEQMVYIIQHAEDRVIFVDNICSCDCRHSGSTANDLKSS